MVKNKSRKPAGRCIFCGRTGLSKEHVWSDWLKSLINRGPAHVQGSESFEFNRTTETFRTTQPMTRKQKQGCLSRRTVRNVCEKHCNNGWMHDAVDAAKPIASKLIQGESFRCDQGDLLKLTTWLAITTVMQEFFGEAYIPPEDRVTLMETGAPPLSWTMWVGYYDGRAWYPMAHTHNTVKLEDKVAKDAGAALHIPDCYVQIATFTLRNLLFHAFTATTLGVVAEYRQFVQDQRWNLFQLWPIAGDRLTWPRVPVLDGELELIVTEFSRLRWNHRANISFRR